MTESSKNLLPLELTNDVTLRNVQDIADVIIAESERQVEEKILPDESATEDFRISCDALNLWRLRLRFCEELGLKTFDDVNFPILNEAVSVLCTKRGYSLDDFSSAQLAICQRVRSPWGYTSLRLAHSRALRCPIRLLADGLQDASLPALIAAMARQLTLLNRVGGGVILLPVNSLRSILRQRKVVVCGVLTRLMRAGIIQMVSKGYGLGKAREFRFMGQRGIDYEPVYEEELLEKVS